MVREAVSLVSAGIIYATVTHPATDAGSARAITSAPQGVTLEVVQLATYATGNTATSSPFYYLLASESQAADGTYDLAVSGTSWAIGVAPAAVTTSTSSISAPVIMLPVNVKGNAGPRVLIPPGMILAWSPDVNMNGAIVHSCITREVNPGE